MTRRGMASESQLLVSLAIPFEVLPGIFQPYAVLLHSATETRATAAVWLWLVCVRGIVQARSLQERSGPAAARAADSSSIPKPSAEVSEGGMCPITVPVFYPSIDHNR